MLRKDKAIINKLMYGRPNVKIQYYKYRSTNGMHGRWIDGFHRVNHAKMLIGYSEKAPANNFFITGGRNIRDSYLFNDKPGYYKYPWLIDYAGNERPFIYYDDFEVEIRGPDVVKPLLSQMLEFWNRDDKTNYVRSSNVNASRPMAPGKDKYFYDLAKSTPMTRTVLSVPFSDDGMLEKFYVQMIDSAQKEILLTTPYFRPSQAISEAIGRASKRGVKMKVLTRVMLAGDDTPSIAEDVNKEGINRHLKEMDVYEWTDPKSIMHAKLLVIDQKLSFISSVNLNARSFIHDTEAGVLILHEATAMKFRQEMLQHYFGNSTQITAAKKVKWLNKKLIDILDTYF
ncbi:MAG: phosphatidylserine/phosphatidylglycerophosphate/cardiolipin synthase family protein [Proteobacteria bacterium]|nr:MAG: phosphatidylserine/phosphatidylglycerophosphate/cardiolipin synthase family protein [Pseudomonadota bacterium]